MADKRWRKLKKHLQAHPYLIDEAYRLSMEEAQKLIDEGNAPTFEEMIRSAMKKSSIPTEKWEKHVRILSKEKRKVRRRQIWIPVTAAFAVVVLFFSATPIGRAWAKEAAQWIVRIFSGHIVVENQGGSDIANGYRIPDETVPEEQLPPAPIEDDQNQGDMEFSSFEELYEKTGLNPIVVTFDQYRVESMLLSSDTAAGRILAVTYHHDEKGELFTQQSWSQGEDEETIISIKEPHFEKQILNGTQTMYCCMNEDENPRLFEGTAIMEKEKVVFEIGFAENELADRILESLQYYK